MSLEHYAVFVDEGPVLVILLGVLAQQHEVLQQQQHEVLQVKYIN